MIVGDFVNGDKTKAEGDIEDNEDIKLTIEVTIERVFDRYDTNNNKSLDRNETARMIRDIWPRLYGAEAKYSG